MDEWRSEQMEGERRDSGTSACLLLFAFEEDLGEPCMCCKERKEHRGLRAETEMNKEQLSSSAAGWCC